MAQENALTVVDASNPLVQRIATAKVAALLDNYLVGTELTGKRLIADLMVQLTINPKLQRCTPQSLFQCLVFAAQRKRSFGPYGVWITPRGLTEEDGEGNKSGPKIVTAIPQLSYQAKNTSAREKGAEQVQSEVVLKGEKFEVVREGGVITDIKHEIDYLNREKPTQANVVGGWGVVAMPGGGRFFKVLTKHDLDQAQGAAASKKGPWSTHYEAMCRKTIEHRTEEDFVGDFTQYGGGVGAEPPPVQAALPPGEKRGDLADDLFARVENMEPTLLERAQTMFEVCGTAEAVVGLKKTEEFKQLWMKASPEERDKIGAMGQARHNKLAAQEKAAADATKKQEDSGGGAPVDAGTPSSGPDTPSDPKPAAWPPPFPALPDSVAAYMTDPALKGSTMEMVLHLVHDAWGAMDDSPSAIEALFHKHRQAWGKEFDQKELKAYGQLKAALIEALKAANAPHNL